MPSICFYFQVHQPFRLRRFSLAKKGPEVDYFDDAANGEICQRVARKCYVPANRTMLSLIEKHKGDFRISYSVTGVAIEQMAKFAPDALQTFVELAKTGCVEFLGETYYHSLAALYSESEFLSQVRLHSQAMESIFGVTPRVFRNTELIYNDRIGELVSEAGFRACMAEGFDDVLGWRSPNFVYRHPKTELRLLLRNYPLSDDIAFRFSNRGWKEFPLTTEKFAKWVHPIAGSGDIVNLFMDYETLGEHQWEDTGIFEFMRHLPEAIMRHPDWNFRMPTEIIERYPAVSELSFHRTVSWADMERDLTAWLGNGMQQSALRLIYEIDEAVKRRNNPALSRKWRRLQTSDHFYYMCTKFFTDGDVHAYFSPYETPYNAFLNYMNVLSDFKEHYCKTA